MSETNLASLLSSLRGLTVYRGLLSRPVTAGVASLLSAAVTGRDVGELASAWGNLCALLIERNDLESLPAAIAGEILSDDNRFVRSLAAGESPSPLTVAAAKKDLETLYEISRLTPEKLSRAGELSLPAWGSEPADAPLDEPWDRRLPELARYHASRGCGRFASRNAFLWRDGRLSPVDRPDPIRLSQLKEYESQKRTAKDNTEAFLKGCRANNILFYGDRGTGKSSLVKALLNHFADRGLRMIEMPKESLRELPDLTALLAEIPMKFIVFIDDLSFSGRDDRFAALKAVLEGGLAARPQNVLIYATSNRRHLLRETFSDREGDEIHAADTAQEAVSLSDRFGLTLTFLTPDREKFLRITEQIAEEEDLRVPREKLLAAAERWALEKGSRSPRYARQFADDAKARLSLGKDL